MYKKKQTTNPENKSQGKFLTRHYSVATLPLFSTCCASDLATGIEKEKTLIQKSNSNKLSMKNLLKKSSIQLEKSPHSVNQSRSFLTSKLSDNQSLHYIHSRKPSQISQVNQSSRIQNIERKPSGKISFNYQKDKAETAGSINNYHTTNYIVEKYIVQPQKMNIIVRDTVKQPAEMHSHTGRYFDLSEEFQQYQNHKDSPKWSNHPYSFNPQAKNYKSPRNSQENGPSNCTFSFGHHQRSTFMSKYLNNMKEVQSKRQSQNSKDSMPRPSLETQKFKNDEFVGNAQEEHTFMKNSFRKTNFMPFQREDFNIIDSEEYESDSSSSSEVIDSYQNIMRRMSESPQIGNKPSY